MTLRDFEDHVAETIVDRGLDYFQQENVHSLEKVAPGHWMAQVLGTEMYGVEVRTHRTQIKSWDCTCPYDFGPVCKHAVAVFYAIASELESRKKNPQKIGAKKKPARKDKVKEILKKTDKKALEGFIISQFRSHAGLKNAFVAHFFDLLDEDPGTKYRSLVRNIYKSAKGRHGFIHYREAPKLVNPLHDLIKKAEGLLAEKNYTESLAIAKTLIEEVPIFAMNMDDSDGGTRFLMDSSFEILYQIADEAPPMMKDTLFDYCLAEYPKKKYSDIGFEDGFLHVLPLLISLKEQEKKFFALIDQEIKKASSERYGDYQVVRLLKTQLDYLNRAKKTKEADALIEASKSHWEFREMLVDKAIGKKGFEEAKELCGKGMQIAEEKQHYGTIRLWQNKMLTIAEKEKSIPDIRKWAITLFFEDRYAMEYYRRLKKTYSAAEWSEVSEGLVQKIAGPQKRASSEKVYVLSDIFVEEKQWDRLLKQIQLNPHSIGLLDKYSKHLTDKFPDEILEGYENALKDMAQDTGRRVYNNIAKYLKKMEKIAGGTEKVRQLIQYFREEYKNRPAMMEVLSKNLPSYERYG
ncbi:MAG: SWIM zinc finger family protein [Pricia sp.]